jgi:uncharacterized membrane protein
LNGCEYILLERKKRRKSRMTWMMLARRRVKKIVKKGERFVILYLRHYIELTVTEVISERKKCFEGKKKGKKIHGILNSNL